MGETTMELLETLDRQLALINEQLDRVELMPCCDPKLEERLLALREAYSAQRAKLLNAEEVSGYISDITPPVLRTSRFFPESATMQDPLRSVQVVPTVTLGSSSSASSLLSPKNLFHKRPLTPRDDSPSANRYNSPPLSLSAGSKNCKTQPVLTNKQKIGRLQVYSTHVFHVLQGQRNPFCRSPLREDITNTSTEAETE